MKSSSPKTFEPLKTKLPVSADLIFVLILYPAFSFADQFKVDQAKYGGTINVENNDMCSLGANM
jgi:hypothetical protein